MWLGAHIGIADGLPQAPVTARRIGGDSIQIFSKSPQMWAGPPISDEAAQGFREAVQQQALRASAVHHSYLINLASPKAPMLRRSRSTFIDELNRAEKLGVDALIFHPGAHLGAGADQGLTTIADSLNLAFDATRGFRVRALLENSAGQGTSLCANFEELATVLSKITDSSRVGVTLDTCHLLANGIDFRTPETYAELVDRLSATVSVERVFAFHLNDAKAPLNSHLDRHANIGQGEIGAKGFRPLLNDRRWVSVPGILETPLDENDYKLYEEDLKVLRAQLVEGKAHPKPRRTRSSRPGARTR